ncbi:hypothetical protein AHiyo8_32400 [Arthrobacter sp. Hiyo8]|nr:hypothetical protein AHiyo8_32400 [Arthrobacter sp. Hiyo8]
MIPASRPPAPTMIMSMPIITLTPVRVCAGLLTRRMPIIRGMKPTTHVSMTTPIVTVHSDGHIAIMTTPAATTAVDQRRTSL